MKIWAHRGASAYAPENTLSSFRLAIELGADGIELDVHTTFDGHLVVAHDERIDRLSNGRGLIVEMTLTQLKRFDFSGPFKQQYKGERIPTLEEALQLIKASSLTVNIELKTNHPLPYPDIEKKTLETVKALGMEDRVLYSSFNHDTLGRLRAMDPEAQIGLLIAEFEGDMAKYVLSQKAQAVHPYYRMVETPLDIMPLREAGLQIHPWTLNRPRDIVRQIKLKTDAIITNHPDAARVLLEENG